MIIVDYCNVHIQIICDYFVCFFCLFCMWWLICTPHIVCRPRSFYGLHFYILVAERMHYQMNRTKPVYFRLLLWHHRTCVWFDPYMFKQAYCGNPLTLCAFTTAHIGYSEIRLPMCVVKRAIGSDSQICLTLWVCFILPNASWPNPNL